MKAVICRGFGPPDTLELGEVDEPFVGREPARHRANVSELVEWWRSGRLRPHTSAVYRLDRAAQAFLDMAGRRTMGKVVVVP